VIGRVLLCVALPALAAGESRALPPVGERAAEARVQKARADVGMLRDRALWAERMAKKGYVTDAQLRDERARLAGAEAALLAARAELKALRPEGGFFAGLAAYALRVRAAGAKVEAAQARLESARERAAWSGRMVKKGYMSPVQAQADQARAADAADALGRAAAELDALRPRPEKK